MYNFFLSRFMKRKLARLNSREPILIGGCGRSGTTLLLSILGAHPSIFAIPHETRTFTNWKSDSQDRLVPRRWRRFCWYTFWYSSSNSNARWCEKTPMNVRHIHRIENYFQNRFRFIHIIRDGRDVLTSVHPRDPDNYWVSIDRWIKDTERGLEYADHPNVLTLKYEDLISDFYENISEICSFIGEPLSDELLNWREYTKIKNSGAWFHKSKDLHKDSRKKWERPEHKKRYNEIMSCTRVRNLLDRLGYTSNCHE